MGASRPVVCVVAVLVGVLLSGGVSAEEQVRYDVAEIVRLVESRSGMPEHVRVNQSITLRALLFTWRVRSTLEHAGGKMTATTQGAPSFMPESFPVDIVSLGATLSLFDLELLPERSAEGYLVLGGARIGYNGAGPQEATFMVDPNDWLVKRASARYSWGTLHVDQEYGSVQGRTLLVKQRATVRPQGFVMEVEYSDYAFLEPAPSQV